MQQDVVPHLQPGGEKRANSLRNPACVVQLARIIPSCLRVLPLLPLLQPKRQEGTSIGNCLLLPGHPRRAALDSLDDGLFFVRSLCMGTFRSDLHAQETKPFPTSRPVPAHLSAAACADDFYLRLHAFSLASVRNVGRSLPDLHLRNDSPHADRHSSKPGLQNGEARPL